MRPFEYASPAALDQVGELLGTQWGANAILAGGTDLLALMKDDVERPQRLVNIKKLPDLAGIRNIPTGAMQGGLRIGALTLIQDVADNAQVQKSYPALAHACGEAASPQIRHMATMGGNLCQRPRDWYYRNRFGLLAVDTKTGKSLLADGDNRYAAIFGNQGPAKFVSPSSIAPVLIAYGAQVVIYSQGKPRALALEKFFVTPQKDGEREHALAPNEIVTEILLPAASGVRAANYEVRQKYSFDWPLATAAVALMMDGGNVKSARVVMGHVAPVPWVSEEAAQALAGKPLNEQTAVAAADAAVAKATPLSRNGYKVQLARVAVKRALLAAAKG
ncbi:MAG: xanthine dehydrogenase family protein subunit M [Terriglobales bacterium]